MAPGNSAASSEPLNGVFRDVRQPPVRTAASPEVPLLPGTLAMVDLSGDQYRAAVLQAPGTTPQEYLVWAANSSQLALVTDSAWWQDQGSGRIPVGSVSPIDNLLDPLAPYSDGSLRVVVMDDGGREIGTITHVVVARGDKTYDDLGWINEDNPAAGRLGSAPYEVVIPAVGDQTGRTGSVTLTDLNVYSGAMVPGTVASVFGGGLSLERGDTITGVRYTIAPLKFWWTKNDRYETRFGWDGRLQRWKPYKGSAPINLGVLAFDTTYTLTPALRTLPLGAILTGDVATPDEYAMLRLGTSPGALSLPVGANDADGFTGIQVVADDQVSSFDFSGTKLAGVVGQARGNLAFSPQYVTLHAGLTVWYSYNTFQADAEGVLGPLQAAPIYVAPIPGPTDYPILCIANRSPLLATVVETETELETAAEPDEGTCLVALSTGRVRLSLMDIRKADPKQPEFNKHFLGATVYYEGCALNAMPQPTKAPVRLVQQDGVTPDLSALGFMYLPEASPWPEDLQGTYLEAYMGLGVSGVLNLPDGTGSVPVPDGVNPALVAVPVRPGGDTLPSPQSLGLVREVADGVGDTIIFARAGAVTETVIVDRNSELPDFPFQVPGGKVYIAKEAVALGTGDRGSRVQIGTPDRTLFGVGKPVYFLQATLNPSTYTTLARVYSRNRIIFRFVGDEVLYFAIDGVAHDWHANTLPAQDFYTADEVAASIQARITAQAGTGIARGVGDRILLESATPTTGEVQIGWGSVKDLSGCAALGFLPGWRVKGGKPNWLSDAGISLGLSRSLLNLDRSKADADYNAQVRLTDAVLSESILPSPFQFLDYPPVEDIAGFDEGVFFNLQMMTVQGDDVRLIDKRLEHFVDIQHRFGEGKFAWLEQSSSSNRVETPTTSLFLGQANVVPETLLGAPGISGGLYAAESGGPYQVQEQGVDYILSEDGGPGVAQLVTRYGAWMVSGAQGAYVAGHTLFTDPSANFLANSTDPEIDPATGQQRIDNSGNLVWLPVLRGGFRIKMASGSYIVTSVLDATHCEVTPPFVSSSTRPTPWDAYKGIPDSLYDPAIVADVVYEPFNHLSEEPFKVRVLSPLGSIAGTDFTAYVADAVAKGRPINLRFGAVSPGTGIEATLTPLGMTPLGIIANNARVLPWTTHVSEGTFDLQVGSDILHPAPVGAFSPDPTTIEYLTADWDDGNRVHPKGELKFSSTMLTDRQSSQVILVETLRAASLIPTGTAEYDPKTGSLRISATDVLTHSGKTLYFVEQMVTTGDNRDVAVAPMIGSVSFVKPMVKGCLVEMTYWLATNEGRRVGTVTDTVTEFLPVFVRREEAVRRTDREFELDPLGEQVWDTSVEPLVFVGPTQQNFGSATDFLVDQPAGWLGRRLLFNRDLPAWVTPVASYAVFNAQGGEQTYNTSQSPVYRPPFFITAGKDNFGLRGNRVKEFTPGQMLRLGADCFYITGRSYFSDSDLTRVDIYPSTVVEVGSRSPGNDVVALITSVPITTVLYPDGPTPVPTTAKAGFMQVVPTTDFPFEPVMARQATMTFRGDLTQFAVSGHIMEVGGVPFTIARTELSEDGTQTVISFTTAFQTAVDPASNPTIKLSYRPVYPPDVREFVGKGALVASEGVELTLFGEEVSGVEQPGRQLAQGTEFNIDSETGVVQLLAPVQSALGPRQWLLMGYTQKRSMAPLYVRGNLIYPRWAAGFRFNTLPSNDNGYLGGRLMATYTFDNPDSFYYRALSLRTYLPDAVQQALDEMKSDQPTSGPRMSIPGGTDNWDYGNEGLYAQGRDLQDKDRAARAFLGFYNDAITAFEQVGETITGMFIGDRDGKFRFWVGRGAEYAPPGYEDDITGALNPNQVWAQVFRGEDPTRDLTFLPGKDYLVDPATCSLTDFRLTGQPLGTSYLAALIQKQVPLSHNDVDDILLLGPSQPRVVATTTAPYYTLEVGGTYQRLSQPSKFSRVYPTSARVLFTLQPGIGSDLSVGDVGSYGWRKLNPATGEMESTYNSAIGQVANPVLGAIRDVSEKTLRPRLARTRIWGYFPNGLPASAFGSAVPVPCFVVSAVPITQVVINPATGYPDPTVFLSQGGAVPDAVAGDPAQALPGFKVGDKIAWGKPEGVFYNAVFPEELDVLGQKLFSGVFVGGLQFGCVITLMNRNGDVISSSSDVLVATDNAEGIPAHLFGIGRADTLYVVPPEAEAPVMDLSGSPTMEMVQTAARTSPSYRMGTDIVVRTDGQVVDLSLPSWYDPFLFPIKEMLGQNTPAPMSHIEGVVEFANMSPVPLETPALRGLAQDDAGDYQIPFKKATATELDRFDEIQSLLGDLMARHPVLGGYYPDEILFNDGAVLGAAVPLGGDYKEPAVVMTATDTQPATDYGTTAGRPGDFLLVEVDPGNPQGWQGMLSVGALRTANIGGTFWSWVEPPRFVTQTNKGALTQYLLHNYAVHTTPGNYPPNPQVTNPLGIRLFDDSAGFGKTILSFQDTVLALNDGSVVGVGNLNTILAASPNNVLKVEILGRPDASTVNSPAGLGTYLPGWHDGRPLLTILIRSGDITFIPDAAMGAPIGPLPHMGVATGVFDPVTGEPVPGTAANSRHIVITGITGSVFFDAFLVGAINQWFLPYSVAGTVKSSLYGFEYSLSLTCTTGGSTSAYIGSDRLTFHEAIDLRLARPRGFLDTNPVGAGYLYETELRVTGVTLGIGGVSTVNDVAGAELTVLSRTGSTTLAGGTWTPAASPNEDGTLKVMSFEAPANIPILASSITAAVQASQTEDPAGGDILTGVGSASGNSLTAIVPAAGAVSRVQKGDVLYIDRAWAVMDAATEKAGTYVVRHAVEPDALVPYKDALVSAKLGSGGGFVTSHYPRVLSLDITGLRLEVNTISMLPATGRVYVIINAGDLSSTSAAVFQKALFSVQYTGFDLLGPNPKLILAVPPWNWANGAVIAAPATDITAAMITRLVGGLLGWHDESIGVGEGVQTLDISVRGGELPDDSSVVGYDSPGAGLNNAVLGFHDLEAAYLGSFQVGTVNMISGVPGVVAKAGVSQGTVHTNGTFDASNNVPVYADVPRKLHMALSLAQGTALNNPSGHPVIAPGVACLLPGTDLRSCDSLGAPNHLGFYAQGGVFLEPSVPQQPLSLAGVDPKVVDASRSLLAVEVGMRSPGTAEPVQFEVRRVRRWHGLQNALNNAFEPLKYVYQVRRGTITGFTRSLQQVGTITAAAGMTLGWFNTEDVNIHPGDFFRVLDTDGTVLDTGIISDVVGATQIRVMPPGLAAVPTASMVGKTFEVYLRQAPVPHEQSNAQLLDLITDRVLHETVADRSDPDPLNWVGGYVPDTDGTKTWVEVANVLYDDSAPVVNFQTKGVRAGDLVVIDGAGFMTVVDERGSYPIGDLSVPTRTANAGPVPYVAGLTAPLDDNRGFYRVKVVHQDHLELDPVHTYAGTLGADVVMGGTRTNLVYGVYPTVNLSLLSTDQAEGQNDLRPTLKALTGSYTNKGTPLQDNHSIRPFSYRIIRPTTMLSNTVIDTVLMMRERILSLIEMLGSVSNGSRGGFYWDWQALVHVEDLGVVTNPESGVGLFPNRRIIGLTGEVSFSPYCNSSNCLGILDRRFWIHDVRLDSLAPDPNNKYALTTPALPFDQVGGPYTAYNDTVVGGSEVRPVLTDQIDLILDVRDRLRGIRYTWLTYRTHRYKGTLARIDRFVAELPGNLASRQRTLLLESSVDKVGT